MNNWNNYNPYAGYNPYTFNYGNQQNGMTWVQGEAGANAYQVMAGQVAVLFDSTRQVFYIKSVDASGKPNPLETYDYTKHADAVQEKPDMSQYVTKEELQQILNNNKKETKTATK